MVKVIILLTILFVGIGLVVIQTQTQPISPLQPPPPTLPALTSNLPTPTPYLPPPTYIIPMRTHVFQTFNNCGPATLSMDLSYYGINVSQKELGDQLRPYQIPSGDNDDKSVTLEELSEKAKEYDLIPYRRPNGDIELLKKFIALDIPVITRTWLKPNEDIGHFRLVRGYDQTSLIQDDSFQGKDLYYSYSDFNQIWKKFNYEYLVLVPKDKQAQAEAILGQDINPKLAWNKAVANSLKELQQDSNDIYARFNLSVAYYNIGDYQKSVDEYEIVENKLPFRTLWYQMEPILAYYKLGDYPKVFQIIEKVLNYHNRAYSELYQIRGEIYLKQGESDQAKQEFEQAVFYNKNYQPAINELSKL